MTVEMTYVALKPLRVGGQLRETGELVPEAEDWPRASAWVSQGYIAPVAKAAVGQDALARAEDRYSSAQVKTQVENAVQGDDVEQSAGESSESDDEVDVFHVGKGWYEIPGADKKLRREEAVEFLASLEDGSEE